MGYKLPSAFVKRQLLLVSYFFSSFLSLILHLYSISPRLTHSGKQEYIYIFSQQVDATALPNLELAHRHLFGGGNFKNGNNSRGASNHTYTSLPKQIQRDFNMMESFSAKQLDDISLSFLKEKFHYSGLYLFYLLLINML